jgi:hypothetical protein
MTAGGNRAELNLGTSVVGAGSTVSVTVPLSGFGIDISNLAFSGSVFIEVELRDAAGALVRRTFSPTRFFHMSGAQMLFYGAEARRTQHNSGDLQGQIVQRPGPEVAGVFDGGAGVGQMEEDTGPIFSAGNPTAGGNTWEFCLRWTYQSNDSGYQLPGGISEDYYASGHLMKARGMKVKIEHASWQQPEEGFANLDNGCFTFNASENTGFKITLFAEARIGTNQNLTLKGFKDGAAKGNNQVTQWKVLANPGGTPRRVYFQTETSDVANLMAFGSFTAFWVDSHTSPGLPGPSTLPFVTEVVDDPNCTEACKSWDGTLWFKPGAVTQEKFGVAHEVGHWLHSQWTTAGPSPAANPYTESGNPALEPLCAYTTPNDGPGGHALRSREHAHGAYNEGVAHFLASLAWNSPDQTEGLFKYYKDGITNSSYDDMEMTSYRVSLEGGGVSPMGGPSDWFHTHCQELAGYSTEMDWLRFLWDYRTNDPAELDQSVPTNHDIFALMQFTKANHGWASLGGVHAAYVDAFNDPNLGQPAWFESRWMSLAVQNGVAQ